MYMSTRPKPRMGPCQVLLPWGAALDSGSQAPIHSSPYVWTIWSTCNSDLSSVLLFLKLLTSTHSWLDKHCFQRLGDWSILPWNTRKAIILYNWWLRWKRIHLQCRRPGFDPWGGKIPWRREWLPTPVFWPGKFHGQRSLVGYSPWGCKELDTTE